MCIGSEVDHSFSSNAEVKNAWSYTFILPTRLHGVVHMDSFYKKTEEITKLPYPIRVPV
jgi:hypothetical protein